MNTSTYQFIRSRLLFLVIILISITFVGCTTPYNAMYSGYGYSGYSSRGVLYEEESLAESLFNSDNSVMSNQAVDEILSGEIDFPDSAKIAVLKFPDNYSNPYNNYLSETYLKNTQSYLDTISTELISTGHFEDVVLLPNLLTPARPTIPLIREAAVRLQAEYILVYKINSNIYSKYRAFKGNEYKAFSTIEMVLIHTRTGVIPYTHIETQEAFRRKSREDTDGNEAIANVIRIATLNSLNGATSELTEFLDSKF